MMTTPKLPPKPPTFGKVNANNLPKPRVRRRAPFRPILLVMLAGFLTALLICVVLGAVISKPISISLGGEKTLTIRPSAPGEKVVLVMGVDHAIAKSDDYSFDGARTDTMMLVRFSTRNHAVSAVSIPRDSKVYLANGRGTDKINAAHALGGPNLAVATVENSFGVPVDNYVVVNFGGVKELVNTLGGVDVYIEKPMRYRDRTAKLNIDFEAGQTHLDGKAAEEFLRFRHDELGDIGRIRRQQQFVMAIAKKLKDPFMFARIPQLVGLANKYIKTNLSFNEMVQLASFMPDIKPNNMRTATLPGRPSGGSISYWLINDEAASSILNRLILSNNIHLLNGIDNSDPIKVGILYQPGFGEQLSVLTDQLTQGKFNVICKQPMRKASTQIIEHTDRTTSELSQKLQTINPNLNAARLVFAPVGSTYEITSCSGSEDYTLVIGGDAVRPKTTP